nr:ribosomal protein L25/Gln-tRNA synthetase, anti-codon-binding domain-containing protein [Tanacetum cinerariifolium]
VRRLRRSTVQKPDGTDKDRSRPKTDLVQNNGPRAGPKCSVHARIRAGSGSTALLESGNVLPIKVHRDPETGKLLNLVFVWADEGTELKVDVPVVFKGEDVCPGLKKGGFLNKIRTSLKYKCPSEHLPQKIEVDISNLDIGDKVFMQDVKVHPSLELLSKNETLPVCKIVAAKLDSSKPTQ